MIHKTAEISSQTFEKYNFRNYWILIIHQDVDIVLGPFCCTAQELLKSTESRFLPRGIWFNQIEKSPLLIGSSCLEFQELSTQWFCSRKTLPKQNLWCGCRASETRGCFVDFATNVPWNFSSSDAWNFHCWVPYRLQRRDFAPNSGYASSRRTCGKLRLLWFHYKNAGCHRYTTGQRVCRFVLRWSECRWLLWLHDCASQETMASLFMPDNGWTGAKHEDRHSVLLREDIHSASRRQHPNVGNFQCLDRSYCAGQCREFLVGPDHWIKKVISLLKVEQLVEAVNEQQGFRVMGWFKPAL